MLDSMTPAFLQAVVDTLLPGLPAEPGYGALPSGTEAGVALDPDAAGARPALEAIGARAGGYDAFIQAAEAARVDIIAVVERELPAAFLALLKPLFTDYYEKDAVLVALGWRPGPPQPQGHALAPFDPRLLEQVKGRRKLWRD
jgi:hypothetical protein